MVSLVTVNMLYRLVITSALIRYIAAVIGEVTFVHIFIGKRELFSSIKSQLIIFYKLFFLIFYLKYVLLVYYVEYYCNGVNGDTMW